VIKILLVIFFILHVVAGALLQDPALTNAAASAGEKTRISLHD
jgi:hypothetical protein